MAKKLAAALRGGSALPTGIRERMESAFGQSLAGVRVHSDTAAAEASRSLGARAFTVGRDVVLGRDAQRAAPTGDQTLAHELTHVIQHPNAVAPPARLVSSPTDAAELEATRIAPGAAGQPLEAPPRIGARPLALVHRQQPPPTPQTPTPPSPTPTPAPAGQMIGPPPPPGLSPEAAAQMAYSATILKRVKPLQGPEAAKLNDIIGKSPAYAVMRDRDAKRTELEKARNQLEDWRLRAKAGSEASGGAPASPEQMKELSDRITTLTTEIEQLDFQLKTMLKSMGTTEEGLVNLVEKEFPALWVRRGKEITNAMLDENKAVVEKEKARYPAGAQSADVDGLTKADQDLNDIYEDTKAMKDGMEKRKAELQQAQDELAGMEGKAKAEAEEGSLPGGKAPTKDEMEHVRNRIMTLNITIQDLTKAISGNESKLAEKRNTYGLRFPIMLQPEYHYGSLFKLSREQLEKTTGGWLQTILDNIEKTRENVGNEKVRVWDLNRIPEMTYQSLGVSEKSTMGDAVRANAAQVKSEKEALDQAVTALVIGVGILAAVATAGGSLVVAAALTGATAGMTLGQLAEHASEYSAESAAQRVALHPELADISKNEPDLLVVVMDLMTFAMDVGAAIKAARAVAAAEKALMKSGDVTAYKLAIKKAPSLPPAAAEKYVAAAGQKAGSFKTIRDTVEKAAKAAKAEVVASGVEGAIVKRELGMLAHSGYEKMMTKLGDRFIVVEKITEDELRKIYTRLLGQGQAAEAEVQASLNLVGANAYYDPAHKFVVCIRGSEHSMMMYTEHELTHHLQKMFGKDVLNYTAEYQAYWMQRDIAKKIIADLGGTGVPEDVALWAAYTDAQIETHILSVHPTYFKPRDFDQTKVIEEVWTMLKNVK